MTYRFAHLELTWLHGVGCDADDAVYLALAEEIARRERNAARGRSIARKRARQQPA